MRLKELEMVRHDIMTNLDPLILELSITGGHVVRRGKVTRLRGEGEGDIKKDRG